MKKIIDVIKKSWKSFKSVFKGFEIYGSFSFSCKKRNDDKRIQGTFKLGIKPKNNITRKRHKR